MNQAETELTLIEPNGGQRKLAMTQSAPGRYSAEFDTPKSGAYHLQWEQKMAGVTTARQSRGLVVNYPRRIAPEADRQETAGIDCRGLGRVLRASAGGHISRIRSQRLRERSRFGPTW